MATLHDLISDIGAELGGDVPSNLPFLILSVEQELWQDLWFIAPQEEAVFTFNAGVDTQNLSTQLTNPERILFTEALVRSDGLPLRRMGLGQFRRHQARGLEGKPEIFYLDKDRDLLMIYPKPRETEELRLIYRKKPEPLNGSSSDLTNPMLGIGYEVLKWGVLYKRIFNPDKFQYWRLQFNEAYLRLHKAVMRQNLTYRGGSVNYDAFIVD